MIIARSCYRETARTALMITAVLLVVFVFFGLTGLLARAARGEIADRVVLMVLGLQALRYLDLLLPLAFYFGALFALARWYRDNEMTVLAACGVGLTEVLKPLLRLAALVALLVAVCAFFLAPESARLIETIKSEDVQRATPRTVAPGVFTESGATRRVFYAEYVDVGGGSLQGVFAADSTAGRQGVIVARSGKMSHDPSTGERFVVLSEGRLYDGAPGAAEFGVVEFERYHLRFTEQATQPPLRTKDMSPLELWRDPSSEASAEWHARLARAVAVPVLALFALVLAHTDARRGRYANLFVAILVYFIYSNLTGFGQALIKKGAVPWWLGLWWVHALFAALAAWMIARRAANRPLWPWRSI
jgi:lipopolysaccharide export system permease protein